MIIAKLDGCLYALDGLSVDTAIGGLIPGSPGLEPLERWTVAADE